MNGVNAISVKIKCFLAVFLLMTNLATAEVYQWKDDQGRIVFGDTPPKSKTSTAVSIDNRKKSGTQFSDPALVKNMEEDAARQNGHKVMPAQGVNPRCRQYVSQLNEVEIYLEHTNTDRDIQKARDLRKLIKMECDDNLLNQKFVDSQCERYRENLIKTEIFLEHTNTQRDQNKVDDLRKQISRECR